MAAARSQPSESSPQDGADREVLITRMIDAPRALVFKAWTTPQHLAQWFAPHGCAIEFIRLDVRLGGTIHSCIRSPQGDECWCVGEYVELAEPARIAYTMALADSAGKRLPSAAAGKDDDWPSETTVTVTFDEVGGRTRLTLHQTVREDVARRTGALPSWLQMLDRLEKLLGTPR